MQSMQLSVLGLGLAAVLAATMAQAQTNTAPINTSSAAFKSADTNLDGRVSRAEFDRQIKKDTFEQLDTDKDGAVSLEEWKAVDKSPEAEKHFAAMDKDRSGRISYPEFTNTADWKSALQGSFESLDRDRDSHLASDELTGRPMFRLLSVNF